MFSSRARPRPNSWKVGSINFIAPRGKRRGDEESGERREVELSCRHRCRSSCRLCRPIKYPGYSVHVHVWSCVLLLHAGKYRWHVLLRWMVSEGAPCKRHGPRMSAVSRLRLSLSFWRFQRVLLILFIYDKGDTHNLHPVNVPALTHFQLQSFGNMFWNPLKW